MTQWLTTLIFHVWDNTGGNLTFQEGECIWLSGSCLLSVFAHVAELWLVLLQLSVLVQDKTHTAVAEVLEVRLFLCRKYWGAVLAFIGLHIIFWSIHVFQHASLCASKELWRKAFQREMMIYQNRRFVGIDQVQLSIYSEGLQVGEERNFKHEKRVLLKAYNIHCWQHDVEGVDQSLGGVVFIQSCST